MVCHLLPLELTIATVPLNELGAKATDCMEMALPRFARPIEGSLSQVVSHIFASDWLT